MAKDPYTQDAEQVAQRLYAQTSTTGEPLVAGANPAEQFLNVQRGAYGTDPIVDDAAAERPTNAPSA